MGLLTNAVAQGRARGRGGSVQRVRALGLSTCCWELLSFFMRLSSSCQKRKKMFISTQVTSGYTFLTELSIIHSLNFSYIKLFVVWTDAHKLPELHMAVRK